MPYYSPTTAAILRRKSPPTCTLSLAHVSAAPKFHSQPTTTSTKSAIKVRNAELNLSTMQVELQVDFSSVITVPVQVHVGDSAHGPSSSPSARVPSLRRSKSRKRIHVKRGDINVIPFPSSTTSSLDNSSVPEISSPTTPSTPHILLRSSNPDVHLLSGSAVGATRRPRKGTVNASVSISTSVRSTVRTSPTKNGSARQARSIPIPQLPPRPSSPAPRSPPSTTLQDKIEQLKKEDTFEPPPYTSPPPPYTPSLDIPADSKSARPLPLPAPNASSPAKSSRIPIIAPTPITPQAQAQSSSRRIRASSSEIKTLLFLYRTIMYGIERRHRLESLKKQHQRRTHSPPTSQSQSQYVSPSTSPSRTSEIHFGRFPLVEEDEDEAGDDAADDDDHPIFGGPRPSAPKMQRRFSSKTPAERAAKDYDVQDALLAIRLRVFLKSQGVSEDELAVQFDEEGEEGEDDVILVGHGPKFPLAAASASAPVPNPVMVSAPAPPPVPAPVPAPPLAPKSEAGKDRPIRSSPPPLSPVPKPSPTVPSMAYMIALIKMRNEQSSGPKLFAVVNDYGAAHNGKGNGNGKQAGSMRGRKSGLRSCAWVAVSEDEEKEVVVEEVEEEFDSDSVADWYAGLSY